MRREELMREYEALAAKRRPLEYGEMRRLEELVILLGLGTSMPVDENGDPD